MDRVLEVAHGLAGLGKELGSFLGAHKPVVACVAVALLILWRWTMPATR